GAVGNPSLVPDHIAVWGLLIDFRRLFDLYVNLRPVRLFEGLPSPLAGRKPGDLDYIVVRENTEGEYGNVGGRIYEGTEREVVMQQAIFSRKGVDLADCGRELQHDLEAQSPDARGRHDHQRGWRTFRHHRRAGRDLGIEPPDRVVVP